MHSKKKGFSINSLAFIHSFLIMLFCSFVILHALHYLECRHIKHHQLSANNVRIFIAPSIIVVNAYGNWLNKKQIKNEWKSASNQLNHPHFRTIDVQTFWWPFLFSLTTLLQYIMMFTVSCKRLFVWNQFEIDW